MTGTYLAPERPVTLTNCDREPIHIPATVQAHGALLVVDAEGTIVQASASTAAFFGAEAQTLLGSAVRDLLADPDAAQLDVALTDAPDGAWDAYNPLAVATRTGRRCNLIGHRIPGGEQRPSCTVLEFEPAEDASWYPNPQPVQRAMAALDRAATVEALQDAVVAEVRRLTGFDRVMLYRFDPDWNGTVVAEAAGEGLGRFLHLRFPATDIPTQARALYLRNRLRLIPTVEGDAVPLVPREDPATGVRLDQSACVLRSVSPIHLQYLQNMGVAASMSISVVNEGQLWGLIACHHYAPRYVPYRLRAAAGLLGQVFAMQLAIKRQQQATAATSEARRALARLVEDLVAADRLAPVLSGPAPGVSPLLDLVEADGAAVWLEDDLQRIGDAPDDQATHAILTWLAQRADSLDPGALDGEKVVQTDRLGEVLPDDLAGVVGGTAGLLAVPIAADWSSALVWFRRPVTQTVTWGGEQKPTTQEADGTLTLHPRASFTAWQERVEGRAVAWSDSEVEIARELSRALVRVVLQRADELARVNADLTRSNAELDAFTYIASHDLKEPLRGITNYAQFLIEDYADELGEDGQAKLLTITRLGQRLDSFIDSLLTYSRVGRLDFEQVPVDLEAAVAEARELLVARLTERGGTVATSSTLPTVTGDPGRIVELLTNLISNGLKYNTAPVPHIEVGVLPPEAYTDAQAERVPAEHVLLYVRDNGIGIRERHLESIFGIFRRLHGRDRYGGGTGAGLTIVRKIAERHGGVVWVESTFGE
ncbi:MAG: ATP-binding protein, partial [Bacteroidota bacterium]